MKMLLCKINNLTVFLLDIWMSWRSFSLSVHSQFLCQKMQWESPRCVCI